MSTELLVHLCSSYRVSSATANCERVRGSSQSRHASPSRLNATTAVITANAGMMTMCGASNRWLRASFSMEPQLGMGASTPRPRKLSVDSRADRAVALRYE
jgi:hypothetical protein